MMAAQVYGLAPQNNDYHSMQQVHRGDPEIGKQTQSLRHGDDNMEKDPKTPKTAPQLDNFLSSRKKETINHTSSNNSTCQSIKDDDNNLSSCCKPTHLHMHDIRTDNSKDDQSRPSSNNNISNSQNVTDSMDSVVLRQQVKPVQKMETKTSPSLSPKPLDVGAQKLSTKYDDLDRTEQIPTIVRFSTNACGATILFEQSDQPLAKKKVKRGRKHRGTDSTSDQVREPVSVGDKGQTAETVYDVNDGIERFRNQLSKGVRQVQTIYCDKGDPFFDDEWTRKRSMEYIAVAAEFLKQQKVCHYSALQELYRSQPSERVYHEIYRLSTFATLKDTAVSLIRLAQNGFYYDEAKDNIFCFSCGLHKKDWSSEETKVATRHLQLSRKIFKQDCKQSVGQDSRDVPINPSRKAKTSSSAQQTTSSSSGTSSYDTSGNRGSSQVAQPLPASQPEEHTRRNAVANGQTPSAGFEAQTAIGSEQNDGHSTSTPATATARPLLATSNLAEDGEQQTGPVQPEQAPNAFPNELAISGGDPGHRRDDRGPAGEPRQLAERETPAGLDMRQAVTPEFVSVQSRHNSFASWPLGDLPQPLDLVPAGFYYLGVADSVRCFYCGVTLKNWRGNDDVWETHVRFRFSCAYVKAIKGEDYVTLTQIKLSATNSVTIPNNQQALSGSATSGNQPTQGEARNAETGNTRRPADSTPRQTNGPRTPRSSQQTGREQRSLPASTTQSSQRTQRQQSSRSPTATQSSLHRQNSRSPPAAAAQPSQARTRSSPEPRTSRRSGGVTINGQDVTDTLQALTDTNSQLRAQRTCRVCKERSVDTIFLPCGHLCTCEVCAANMRDCCLCSDKIMGTAHVFLE